MKSSLCLLWSSSLNHQFLTAQALSSRPPTGLILSVQVAIGKPTRQVFGACPAVSSLFSTEHSQNYHTFCSQRNGMHQLLRFNSGPSLCLPQQRLDIFMVKTRISLLSSDSIGNEWLHIKKNRNPLVPSLKKLLSPSIFKPG